MKYIAHIDLNAFFAQVETNRNPKLENIPMVVGSDLGHGVIATSNYAARKYGIRSGMATALALKIYPKLVVIPGDYELYSRESKKFFNVVKSRFNLIEMASIDECYVDCTEVLNQFKNREEIYDYMFDFQMSLYKKTNLKCSIGLAHNKFLAKMGSDLKKPLGLTLILNEDDVHELIWPLPIKSMYGIGEKTYPRLQELGINTIKDLATCDNYNIKKILGSNTDYLIDEANGYGSDFLNPTIYNPKSISNDFTFVTDTNDYEEIKNRLIICAENVADIILSINKFTRKISIKIRDSEFNTITKGIRMKNYTNEKKEIVYWALKVFEDNYNGDMIRLIGCTLEGCIEANKLPQKKDDTIQLNFATKGDE